MEVELLGSALLLAAFGAGAYHLHRVAEGRRLAQLGEAIPRAEATLTSVAQTLDSQCAAALYLPRQLESELQAKLASVRAKFSKPAAARDARRLSADLARRFQAVGREAVELAKRLEAFNAQHIQLELQRHETLLIHDHGLNDEQVQAVLRDDSRNLVIAGAGAGKTRVLIARMEYLTKRQARVEPSRIAAVTYTGEAADEIKERLSKRGIHGAHASTLHSLGNSIVAAARGEAPNVINKGDLKDFIQNSLADAIDCKDPALTRLYFRALANFFRTEREDVPEQPADHLYRTLRGKRVDSIGERIIADYLFLNGIEYEHAAIASWAPRTEGKRPYRPDFYLVGHDTYIEYWGVNEQGQVPHWFSGTSEDYQAKMTWAREVFRNSPYRLLEIYDYERKAGKLETVLRERLDRAGIHGNPITHQALAQQVRDFARIDKDLAKMLEAFISNARALRLTNADIPLRLVGHTPRVTAFGEFASELLRRYEGWLARDGAIDFSDMLYEAAEALESAKVDSRFRFDHILVDEFQDLSPDKARLIRALLGDRAKLFAVGDDYQGIYAFSGGDIGYIVDFDHHFGTSTQSLLTINYRSPELIVEAGKAVIEKNSRQIRKPLTAGKSLEAEAAIHIVDPTWQDVVAKTADLIAHELKLVQSPNDIMVISRANWPLDHLRTTLHRKRIPYDGQKGVRLLSAHKSKGAEAAVVIIADASEDMYGFPSQVQDPDVLAPVRIIPDDKLAEERRLFYVAVTRAMRRLHLVVRDGRHSRFIHEIEGTEPPNMVEPESLRADQRISGVFRVERLYDLNPKQAAARMHQKGLLNTGRERVTFASWTWKHPATVAAGKTYSFTNLLVTDYEGKSELEIDTATRVMEVTPMEQTEAGGSRPLKVRRVAQ